MVTINSRNGLAALISTVGEDGGTFTVSWRLSSENLRLAPLAGPRFLINGNTFHVVIDARQILAIQATYAKDHLTGHGCVFQGLPEPRGILPDQLIDSGQTQDWAAVHAAMYALWVQTLSAERIAGHFFMMTPVHGRYGVTLPGQIVPTNVDVDVEARTLAFELHDDVIAAIQEAWTTSFLALHRVRR